MIPNVVFYIPDNDFYATLLQLGLEPNYCLHKATQTLALKKDVATQTKTSKGILWGYF